MILNKKIFSAFAAVILSAVLLLIPANADNDADEENDKFIADTSSAVLSGHSGVSFSVARSDFDASRISEDSKIVIKYKFKNTDASLFDADGTPVTAPAVLLLGGTEVPADISGTVPYPEGAVQVTPSKFTDHQATFTYEDIIGSLGTTPLSEIDMISVASSGDYSFRCTAFGVTNVLPALPPEPVTLPVTEISVTEQPEPETMPESEAPFYEPPAETAVSEQDIQTEITTVSEAPADETPVTEFSPIVTAFHGEAKDFFDKFDKKNSVALYITLILCALGALTITLAIITIICKTIIDIRKGKK